MTADVYAGDDALRAGARKSPRQGVATFSILADADPGVLMHVSAVLNLLNVVPRMLRMESGPGGTATFSAWVDCAESQAELVARKLERLTSVREVALLYDAARLQEAP